MTRPLFYLFVVLADQAGVQFHILNRSKGAAVHVSWPSPQVPLTVAKSLEAS